MIPIYKYKQIRKKLAASFENQYKRKDVNITGILLARPELAVTKNEILPHLNDWNYRSDSYTEFFCVGYTPDSPKEDPEARPVTVVAGEHWFFSPRAFSEFLEDLESQTNWRYDSACYLLITNSRYDRVQREAFLDFRGAIIIDIGQAIRDDAIESASQLADNLFEFAKEINENTTDPVWEFSDEMGLRVVKRSPKDSLLAFLPKRIRNATKQAIHFVTIKLDTQGNP